MTRRLIISFKIFGATTFTLIGGLFFVPSVEAAQPGNVVKVSEGQALYYVDADNQRFVFPNEKVYLSWFTDFARVKLISSAELQTHDLGGNVTYRPGTRLVKVQTDPKVYAVTPGGVLRWIQTEALARQLYGGDWPERIDDVAAIFFSNYARGPDITESLLPSGSLVRFSGDNSIYYLEAGQRRLISDTALIANDFADEFIVDSSLDVGNYPAGPELSGLESNLRTVAGRILEALSDKAEDQETTSTTDTSSETTPIDESTQLVREQLILAGAKQQALANFRFTASLQAQELTKVQLSVPVTNTDEVKKLYVFNDGVQLGQGVAVNGSTGIAQFSFARGIGLVVPKDGSAVLKVKGDLNTTALGADSGAAIVVTLKHNTGLELRGINPDNTLQTSFGSEDLDGPTMYFFKTKPKVSSVALGSPFLLNGVENEIYKFQVTASEADDLSLKQIKFSISSVAAGTGNLSDFRLFRGNNEITSQVSIVTAGGESLESGGASLGEGVTSAYVVFDGEEIIAAGGSRTYTLKASVLGFSGDSDFVGVKIPDESQAEPTHKYLSTDANGLVILSVDLAGSSVTSPQSFIWSDNSVVPHSSSTSGNGRSADWANGFLVEFLPTTSLTTQKL